jgi:hypothetical protein
MIFKKNGNIVETLGDIRLFVEATDLGGTRQLRLPKEGRMYCSIPSQQAHQALDDAYAALRVGRSVARGKVRMSAASDFGRRVLKGWLDEHLI